MPQSSDRHRRYVRQTVLPEIGEGGQAKLAAAKVLVVGAGGLGSPCLYYLAAAGVGSIGIVDHDRVELSNLNRQILHENMDIGRSKVESAADALADLNPEITIQAHTVKLDASNVDGVIADYDIIADGSDNIPTRFLLHDACFRAKKPYVTAAIEGFGGHLGVFTGYEPDKPCYRCLFPDEPDPSVIPDCSQRGVLGAFAGVVGSWQALEIVKIIVDLMPKDTFAQQYLIFDGKTNNVRRTAINKDQRCTLCADN